MIDFKHLELSQKEFCDKYLRDSAHRGCGYSFVNLFLWGRQKIGFAANHLVFFSQYNRKSVYGFPVGQGDVKPALDAIIADAQQRGIPCRMVGLTEEDCQLIENLYPGKFRFHNDRDFFDYVYDIHDLADLKGRKYQKKRNHLNRFRQENPRFELAVITEENLPEVEALVQKWYDQRLQADPLADFYMEQAALKKALKNGNARRVFLACNADPAITEPIAALCQQYHVDLAWVRSMNDLGHACGIEVGAAAAAAID